MKRIATLPKSFAQKSHLALVALLAGVVTCCGNDDMPAAAVPSGGSVGNGARPSASGTGGDSGTPDASSTGGTAGLDGTGGADSGIDPPPERGGTSGSADATDVSDAAVDPTVRGMLKTPRGTPVAGSTVVIGNSVTVSDASGEFVVENVPQSYDLMILRTLSGMKVVELYVGLSSRRPVVDTTMQETTTGSATVSGAVEPRSSYPQGPSQRTLVAFRQVNIVWGATLFEAGFGPNFGFTAQWFGSRPIAGQLYALQWTIGTTGAPTAYSGWSAQALTLTNGISSNVTVTLGPVAQQEIAGTVTFARVQGPLKASILLDSIRLSQEGIQLPASGTTIPYRYLVPTGVAAEKTLEFTAAGGLSDVDHTRTITKLTDSVTTVDVELISPPAQALPVERAAGVDVNTQFAWISTRGCVYKLQVTAASGSTMFLVYTASTTARIPDASATGVPLSAEGYSWVVEAIGPAQNTDDLVSGKTLLDTNNRSLSATSTLRTFTAAPR